MKVTLRNGETANGTLCTLNDVGLESKYKLFGFPVGLRVIALMDYVEDEENTPMVPYIVENVDDVPKEIRNRLNDILGLIEEDKGFFAHPDWLTPCSQDIITNNVEVAGVAPGERWQMSAAYFATMDGVTIIRRNKESEKLFTIPSGK